MSQDAFAGNETVKRKDTDRFPCPSCGANMVFNPATQMLACSYCENHISIGDAGGDIEEHDFYGAEEDAPHDWGSEKQVIHCESCGAETVIDALDASRFCAFCGSPHVIKNDRSAGIAPESLIPFKVTVKQATESFQRWIGKRFFAPRALKSRYQADRLSGVYVPCWTYDSDTFSSYTAEGGTYYYETHTEWVEENGQRKMVTKQVRKIRWWPTSGIYSEFFNDVLVNASSKTDDSLMAKIEPFHLNELVHYKPEYLSGFLAEHYSVGLKEGWEKAVPYISGQIHQGIIEKINADEVRNLNIHTQYQNITYKHILLPVWISAFRYGKKSYRFMVNGQTGEVKGQFPLSPWKVAAAVLAGIAVLGAAAWFISNYAH